jgi:hypothetical protein
MIKKGKTVPLFMAGAGVEICWVYAWASFSMTAIMDRPYSFPGAISTFLFAALCTGFSAGRGWRIVQIASLQVLGFVCAALGILHAAYYSSHPVLSTVWLVELIMGSRTPLEWVNLVLIIVWTLLFWISGVRLAMRPKAYFTVCSRFDIGLAAFFCLFLAKLVLITKGGMRIDDPAPLLLVYPFFLLSLLSIGMARIETHSFKDFLPGYRGIGIMASFAAAVFLSAGSFILFFLPGMIAAAGIGYRVVKAGSGLLFPIIEGIVRFMFMGRGPRPEPSGASPKEHVWGWFVSSGSWWTELIEKVMRWGIKGFVLLLALLMLGFVIFWVIKWLFSRTALVRRNREEPDDTLSWWIRLRAAFIWLYRKVLRSTQGCRRAMELYDSLLSWGRHSGFYHSASETPLEFASRLNHCFPRLDKEIDLIVSAFNREVYAETDLPGEQLAHAKSAWRRMRSPVHWPLRIKVRFFGSADRASPATKN